jgi:hypothetical protein
VIQNGGVPLFGNQLASLARVTETSLVELPVDWAASTFTVIGASAPTGSVRSLGLTLRM